MQANQVDYHIRANTTWRPASCEEIGNCQNYLNGWATIVDESTALGQRQAAFIRGDKTRAHTEDKTASGLTQFVFSAGQQCFAQHQQPVAHDPQFGVVGINEYSGRLKVLRTHSNADAWADDLRTHQDDILRVLD